MSAKTIVKRVAVAMSGGVDSSTSALLLKQAGYEVIGLNMLLWDDDSETGSCTELPSSAGKKGGVEKIADMLGIPLHIVHLEELFKKEVVDFFLDEYLSGRTPNPCVMCNKKIKFDALWNKAEDLGADALATGHYARIEESSDPGKYRLFRGLDMAKDQSYFLFTLSQDQLGRTMFPLGGMKKSEVRELARDKGLLCRQAGVSGLPVSGALAGESQDLCFISERNYLEFIRKHAPGSMLEPGEIVDEQGRALGEHSGIFRYTVGQHKGLGNITGGRYYVLALQPEDNLIIVGSEDSLLKDEMLVRDVNWITDEVPLENEELMVQIRYNSRPRKARVKKNTDGRVRVRFTKPVRAITPGQAAVFYRSEVSAGGQEVLGGGWIE